jgi:hypothetical protein
LKWVVVAVVAVYVIGPTPHAELVFAPRHPCPQSHPFERTDGRTKWCEAGSTNVRAPTGSFLRAGEKDHIHSSLYTERPLVRWFDIDFGSGEFQGLAFCERFGGRNAYRVCE